MLFFNLRVSYKQFLVVRDNLLLYKKFSIDKRKVVMADNFNADRESPSVSTGESNVSSYGSAGSSTLAGDLSETSPSSESGAGGVVKEVVGQAQEKTKQVMGQAQEKAISALSDRKSQAAEGLGSVAQAIRQTGDQLRQQDQATFVAEYADKVANQVERFSNQLRERDVEQFIGDAQDLARRQPGLFLGGAFALGVFLARFLKSSSRHGEPAMAGYYGERDYYAPRNYSDTRSYSGAKSYSSGGSYATGVAEGSGAGRRDRYGSR
jgi:hypothetical protein